MIDTKITDDDSDLSDGESSQDEDAGLSERRRRHNALMASWIQQRADKQLAEQVSRTAATDGSRVDEFSVEELMKRHTDKKIIENPREYQLELFERAKERNTLAVLDTGTGKTLIAALLIRWMLDRELQHRHDGGHRRITFFVVSGVALAFQQHSMLQCNLDHKIVKLYGDLNVDLYTQAQWEEIFKKSMGVVCTAEILHSCLIRSFIKMSEINLLIFDEAHHAKKNHAFSRIMKDHYHKSPKEGRPKIFGMTASPVDAKIDVIEAAKELETLLDSQIATSRLLDLTRPDEKILGYGKPPPPYSTVLGHKISRCFGQRAFFDEFHSRAQLFTSQLGEWCGDQYWRQCLSEDIGPKMENEYKKRTVKSSQNQDVKLLNSQMEVISEARQIVKDHDFLAPQDMPGRGLSEKVRALKKFLAGEFENPTESKCIVFVGHRQIAFLLVELFKYVGSPHLKCAAMVGTRAAEVGETPFSLTTQIKTLSKFEEGLYNCLFATTVAEEGLDVADCNIIVRFDLYHTMIQYVQSRGRARHHNSKYIHMMEKGNTEHEDRLKMAAECENKMRQFVETLPKDRLLLGDEADLEKTMMKEKSYQIYKEESTGALLTYISSLTLLHHFLDFLPQEAGAPPPIPTYVVQPQNGKFVCEIIFPEQSPIKSVMGRLESRKSLARRSAAFNACLELRRQGLLDKHLMPTIHRILPKMRNARLALDEHKRSSYTVRLKPECWQKGWGTIPTRLFAAAFDLDKQGACGRPHARLLLLTRDPIPAIPSFPLWPRPDVCSEVQNLRLENPLDCTEDRLTILTSFTLQIFKDVYNKEYQHDNAAMSYWIAPVLPDVAIEGCVSADRIIDWQAVLKASTGEEIKWQKSMPTDDLLDRYLIDPGDGSRRFFPIAIEENLKPTDRPPADVVQAKAKLMNSIIDYSDSTWGQRRYEKERDLNQPVLKVHKPTQRRNIFQPWSEKEIQARNLAYICPEPLRISCLSTAVVTMAYLFPAIIWRIESYLIAQDACKLLGLTIDTGLALEALTKDSDNTHEHKEEQVNVRRGMGRNYERLEFIGDCFLKMATTISLFTEKSTEDEFSSHVSRMVMICNQNLFQHATAVKLYEFIRADGFSRRIWYPEGLKLLRGKGAQNAGADEAEAYKKFSDKTIADVCEALIGAALLTTAESGDMDMAVKAVTIMVASGDHTMERWSDYYRLYHKPVYQTSESTAAQKDLAEKAYRKHDYKFRYPRVLQSAFTHPSYPFIWDKIPNYQRLEFLGDALLDMCAVNLLYRGYPDRDPHWLTEHKMAIVSNKFLGALCVRLGFNHHLRSYNSEVMRQVRTYCDEIEEIERQAQGAVDYWTQIARDPPKCLADIVESYIGAVFVDSEYDFKEVERFFDSHILPYFHDMSIYDTFANNHPMIVLSHMLTVTYRCHDFRVLSEEVPSDDGKAPRICCVAIIHDQIITDDWSTSSRYGKARVASKLKHMIEGLAPYQYRSKYGCNCKMEDEDANGVIPASQQIGTAI